MKHSFIAFSILASTFTVTLIACSKKDGLINDEKNITSVRTISASRNDTPYGKPLGKPVKVEPEIKIIPAAKDDTPYGK